MAKEMLVTDMKSVATRSVLCKADARFVGSRGIGGECYVSAATRTKYCAIHGPVITGTSNVPRAPFVVPRCGMTAKAITTNGELAVAHQQSDVTTQTLTEAELADPWASEGLEWLLTIERDCGPPRHNPYHCTSDILSSFLALRSAGADPRRTRIVFTDKQEVGPYEMMWRSIAGVGVHSAAAWRKLLLSNEFAPPRVVAHILPMKPPQGPLWHNFWQFTQCMEESPLFLEFHGLVLARVLGATPADSMRVVRSRFTDECTLWPSADNTRGVHVTIAARRPAARYQGQTMQRQLANEAELAKALAEQLPKGTKVASVDFGELSWPEQLALARNTTVLVGMHGAGLTWSMFLEPGGGLVEMHQFQGGSAPPKGMSNIAIHSGLTHIRWVAQAANVASNGATVADIAFVVQAVNRAITESQRFCGVLSELVDEAGGWDVVLSGRLPQSLRAEAEPRWVPFRQYV